MILLNTKKYRTNELAKENNNRLFIKSSCEVRKIKKTLTDRDIERFMYSYRIDEIVGKYYNTDIKIYSSDSLSNQFKKNIAEIRYLKSNEFIKAYRDFESNLIGNLDLYNRIYKETKLYNNLIKYGRRFLDLLGNKKLEFIYNDSCYEFDNKLYFDIDIVGIDVTIFTYLQENSQLEPLLNEVIFNYGAPYTVNNEVNNDEYEYRKNPMDVFIVVCILCYIITESIIACNNKNKKQLCRVFKNVNIETLNMNKDTNTFSIKDFNNKLNQMYIMLKDKIIKYHITQTNSYYKKRLITLKKDTKLVYEINDLVLFMFHYLTNNIINGKYYKYEKLRDIEEVENFREFKIAEVLLSAINEKKKKEKIENIRNKSYEKLKKELDRKEIEY